MIHIQLLNDCINFEIRIGENCVASFVYLDHLVKLEISLKHLLITLNSITNKNPFLIVGLGNFNAKTSNWYKNDINTYEGLRIDAVTSQLGIQQIINEPTYLTCKSCIGLIFTSQTLESGVHSSLHANCHHQIVFVKINLKNYYPPPYECEIWHYEKANADLICRSIDQFPWDIRFAHTDINQKVYWYNQTIKSILCNFYTTWDCHLWWSWSPMDH